MIGNPIFLCVFGEHYCMIGVSFLQSFAETPQNELLKELLTQVNLRKR